MSGKMEYVEITIKGRIPSKKNSRVQFYNKYLGRTINIPNADYTKWHKSASAQILIQKTRNVMLRDVWGVVLRFHFPDNRKSDLTNKAESIMDLLVDNKVLPDDSWQNSGRVILRSEGIDKNNPRCFVRILYRKELL